MTTPPSSPQAAESRKRGGSFNVGSPRLRVSAVRFSTLAWLVVAMVIGCVHSVTTQQLLDRVIARVAGSPITQTDLDAAIAFGIVERQAADGRSPNQQLIDRRLMLTEVTRFPPREPEAMAIGELVAKMKANAGSGLDALMKRTGVDEARLAELARDTLRIESYVNQRFGTGPRAAQQITRWLEDLHSRGDVVDFSSPQ